MENNSKIALDVLYAKKEEKTYPAYILKDDSNFEKKKFFFFDHLKRRGTTLSSSKKLSTLSRGITSKHDGDFYCLSCLHSLTINNKLALHKTVCQNKDFCSDVMPFEDTKILKFNQYEKSDKNTIYYLCRS